MSMITSYKIYDEAITVDMVVSFEEANTPTESTTPPSQRLVWAPFDSELLWPTALRRALVFAKDMGFFDLIIEGECKSLFRILYKAGLLIEDIKCLLLSFRVVNFISINSSCNRASQKLAKMACSHSLSEVWLEVCPSTILDIVTRDSPSL
ncbi:hypothetical protein FCV25MIE_25522 [Fagus crenata]